MVMVILGGMLADRIGLMSAAVLFSLLICGGTTIVAFAAPYSFRGMLFGRMVFGKLKCSQIFVKNVYTVNLTYTTFFTGSFFLFFTNTGLGAESLNVVQISMLSRWFSNDATGAAPTGTPMGAPRGRMCPSFATSLAVAYSISSLGTVLAYDAVPYMADSGGVGVAMWAVGSFPCYLSLFMTLLLPWVELYVIGPRSTLARSVESSQRPSGETADYGVGVETRSDGVVIDDRGFDGDFDERDGGGGGERGKTTGGDGGGGGERRKTTGGGGRGRGYRPIHDFKRCR